MTKTVRSIFPQRPSLCKSVNEQNRNASELRKRDDYEQSR
jgi:hypothetical protein